jgi:hypothetical protein
MPLRTGNIIGEGFDDWVDSQVKIRQEILGKLEYSPQDINYFASKTAWLRLASSVDVNSSTIPAKSNVLFGGITNDSQNNASLNYGINLSSNRGSAYNIESSTGIKPMPGLESANITHYNRGSLRKATIKLKVHTPAQFQQIDKLYLRLGYTILLEWGWTIYYDNNKNLQQAEYYTPAYNNFFKQGSDQYTILKDIRDHRKTTNGNYDGFLGVVTNFNWTFNNGEYDITITAISIGDVIESLSINKKNSSLSDPESSDYMINEKNLDILPMDKATFDKYKNYLTEYLKKTPQISQSETLKFYLKVCELAFGIDPKLINQNFTIIPASTIIDGNNTSQRYLHYIKLGILIEFINRYLLIYDKNKPYCYIDNDFDNNIFFNPQYQDSSLVVPDPDDPKYSIPLYKQKLNFESSVGISQLSSNPLVCVTRLYGVGPLIDSIYDLEPRPNTLGINESPNFHPSNKDNIGRLMHLYVCFDHIYLLLENLKDDEGNISVYKFLDTLMSDIQESLGSINKFVISYDSDTNRVKIMDDFKLKGIKSIIADYNDKYTTINVSGVYPGKIGSFVRNVEFKTEISKDLASMLAIGAQSNGNIVGENATAFSKWNTGLIDRITPSKLDVGDEKETPEYKIYRAYHTLLSALPLVYDGTTSTINTEGTQNNSLTATNKEYQQLMAGYFSNLNFENPTSGFIPLNLSLTLDGMSGMRMYEKFSVTQDILPESYPKGLEFLLKNITHNIDKNSWTVNLESLSVGVSEDSSPTVYSPNSSNTNNPIQNIIIDSTINEQTTDSETLLFYNKLLEKLSAPKTESNINFLKAWRQAEGGKASWNPFNTTYELSNSTNYNSIGVKNYNNINDGVNATFLTLNKKIYSNIVSSLKKGIANKEDLLKLVTEWQEPKEDLWNWVRGPLSKKPALKYYIKGILQFGPLKDIPIYKKPK